MNKIVYFSHSYRPRDIRVNEYFALLMEAEGFLPSLDPPSTKVNSAKLERHLAASDAMIVILTERESGVSPHILYETGLGIRSQKPLLVFVEDTLPANILPPRILQRRFSLRSFPRYAREHRQSLTILRSYIGESAPRYQGLMTSRTCLLLGVSTLDRSVCGAVTDHIERRCRYSVVSSASLIREIDRHPMAYDVLREIDLVVAFIGPGLESSESFLLGAAQGAGKPVLSFVTGRGFPSLDDVPVEYRPRTVDADADVDAILRMLGEEFEIFEQDFLELEDDNSTDRYMKFLANLGGRGTYGTNTRVHGVEVVVGDRYDIQGQTGAVGRNAHVHDTTFHQIWQQTGGDLDLPTLATELERVRMTLRAHAKTPEDDRIVAEVGQAELSAKGGDGPGAIRHLRTVGKWALNAATTIGAGVAAAAIRSATGL